MRSPTPKTPEKIWAYCPRCHGTQRFVRAETNHGLHLVLTVVTVGLWGVSWLAVVIGRKFWPWRCKTCGCNEPDLSKAHVEGASKDTEPVNDGV